VVRDEPGGPPGKLQGAARRLTQGGAGDTCAEAAAALGLALILEEEERKPWEVEDADGNLLIWPECWEAVVVFTDVVHYGRRGNGFGASWIDPEVIRHRMAMAGRELDLELWRDLREMELAARREWAEQAKQR
jgi:hypothetical protein